MANPLKGEAKLGDYTLTINFGVFCVLEEEMELKTEQIIDLMLAGLSFRQLRTIVRAMLQPKHPDIAIGEVECAIDAAGGFKPAYLALGAALRSYSGDQEEKDQNPPKAA
jgi:hypothetical protein